jgi:hypothetical protein
MFLQCSPNRFHFGSGLRERPLHFPPGGLHFSLELGTCMPQLAFDFAPRLLEFAALLLPGLPKLPSKVFK